MSWEPNRLVTERAIIARGMVDAIIMATDGPSLLMQIEQIGVDRVEEIIGDDYPEDPGLYLYTGKGKWATYMTLDGPSDPELEWEGEYTPATGDDLEAMYKAQVKTLQKMAEEEEAKYWETRVAMLQIDYKEKIIGFDEYRQRMMEEGIVVFE